MKRFLFAILLVALPAFAQNTAPPLAESSQTREQLHNILRAYPPSVAGVLRLDPTLLSNDGYMSNYPALATFAKEHPEVSHNPAYFFGDPYNEYRSRIDTGDIAGFLVFLVITSVVIWIVKLVIEQRRWHRLTAIQTDVHSKLLDRFTSNDELLAYLQSPAGRKFLESAPLPLEPGPRPMSAPVGRIFWSLQAGLVLLAAGIGFDLVSLRVQGIDSATLYGIGVIALLIGVALVISAGVFYLLSRRFGLWQTTVS